jgi:hypothetical protein
MIQPDDLSYSRTMVVRCPESLPLAVKQAAQRHMTNCSSYVRSAILRQLKIDGCSPSTSGDGE